MVNDPLYLLKYLDLLPARPRPKPFESHASHVFRIAVANGISNWITLNRLFGIFVYKGKPSRELDRPSFGQMPRLLNCSEADLKATTFHYMLEKFGRSGDQVRAAQFLTGSVSTWLRYCPICLAEKGYHALTWRFLHISSCIEHRCRLISECPHCQKQLNLLYWPIDICVCPICKGDLAKCNVELVNETEHSQSVRETHEIEYLVQPASIKPLNLIGPKLKEIRKHKDLTGNHVCIVLNIAPHSLYDIETHTYGRFLDIRGYAEFLGVPLSSLIEDVAGSAHS